jgi:hypothetical protein
MLWKGRKRGRKMRVHEEEEEEKKRKRAVVQLGEERTRWVLGFPAKLKRWSGSSWCAPT